MIFRTGKSNFKASAAVLQHVGLESQPAILAVGIERGLDRTSRLTTTVHPPANRDRPWNCRAGLPDFQCRAGRRACEASVAIDRRSARNVGSESSPFRRSVMKCWISQRDKCLVAPANSVNWQKYRSPFRVGTLLERAASSLARPPARGPLAPCSSADFAGSGFTESRPTSPEADLLKVGGFSQASSRRSDSFSGSRRVPNRRSERLSRNGRAQPSSDPVALDAGFIGGRTTRKRRPQYFAISGINGRPSNVSLVSSVARISATLRTSTIGLEKNAEAGNWPWKRGLSFRRKRSCHYHPVFDERRLSRKRNRIY